ncbi:MAG: gamma carbonic anhydrase family protein [Flavobacteriaceae bacterium]|nr:gamma carbonic anhydrase family protein [Flavobacteriaceae bacterium]
MALIQPLLGKHPSFGRYCFLAENATVIGDVKMGNQCSVWFNAVIRGDVNSILIGNAVNIQDQVMVHCTYKKTKTLIGNHVSIGHRAIIHGCEIQDNVLIGMGAIIMDGVLVEEGSVVAAGAVVLENTVVEKGSIYAGVPAIKVKSVSPELMQDEVQRIAKSYITYSSWYK